MSERQSKLEAQGFPIDKINPGGDLILPVVLDERTLYVSGQVPLDGKDLASKGKVPSDVSVEEATRAAALCAANALRVVHRFLGDLEGVERVLRITGYVNADPDFTDEHLVIHGASNLMRDVFGAAGTHARTAIGVAQLPLGSSVEVEMILKITPECAARLQG